MSKHVFPSPAEKERIETLKIWRQLYDGDHYDVFGIKDYFVDGTQKEKELYITINLAALIAEYYADMVAGQGVLFDVENTDTQDKINDITDNNNLDVALFESAVTQSTFGFVPILVRKDIITGKALIEEIPIDQYFPFFSGSIKPVLTKVILASRVRIFEVEKNKSDTFLFQQIYFHGPPSEGQTEKPNVFLWHRLFRMNTQGELTESDLALFDPTLPTEPIDLEINELPIKQVNNIKMSGDLFGKSDFKDVETLMQELNDRSTQISVQLIKHMNARMALPQGTLDDTGNIKAAAADIIEVADGETKPGYITNNNPQMDQGFVQINNLMHRIAAISKVPPDVLGVDVSKGAEKVEAIKIRLFNTLRKVQRKRLQFEQPLIEIMNLALKFEEVENDEKIKIIWDNVLPQDETAETKNLILQVEGGLKSNRTAVQDLQELAEKDLEAELLRIQADKAVAVPVFASPAPVITSTDEIQ